VKGAASDAGLLIGMTVPFARLDVESASAELLALGFEAVEVHTLQLGPGLAGVPVHERHAAAAGDALRAASLLPVTLNAAGAPGFEPVGDEEEERARAVGTLAHELRLASALGASRVLCWDGRVTDPARADSAPERLAAVIDAARTRAALTDPPAVSVELHPFTFALEHDRVAETALALREVGAGICLDFCHFGVALGSGFGTRLDDALLDAVNHVHLADSDCSSSELHFPLGEGVLDVAGLAARFAGRRVALAWDMFSWPAPRAGIRAGFDRYRDLVRVHREALGAEGLA
jgi:sugar phosphate isomerase/epimerase